MAKDFRLNRREAHDWGRTGPIFPFLEFVGKIEATPKPLTQRVAPGLTNRKLLKTRVSAFI